MICRSTHSTIVNQKLGEIKVNFGGILHGINRKIYLYNFTINLCYPGSDIDRTLNICFKFCTIAIIDTFNQFKSINIITVIVLAT